MSEVIENFEDVQPEQQSFMDEYDFSGEPEIDPVLGDIEIEERERYELRGDSSYRIIETVRVLTPVQHKIIQRRENWVKFGECKGVVGPEQGITHVEEPQDFVLGNEEKKERLKKERLERERIEMEKLYNNIVGAKTWQANKKVGEIFDRFQRDRENQRNSDQTSENIYRPPGRGGANVQEYKTALRITNLGNDCTDDDLEELFSPFGRITRRFLAKDDDGSSKGYAFVHYMSPDDAARALAARHNYGWNYLILNVEYAEPKKEF